jgi:hypothetical protein
MQSNQHNIGLGKQSNVSETLTEARKGSPLAKVRRDILMRLVHRLNEEGMLEPPFYRNRFSAQSRIPAFTTSKTQN